MENFIIIYAAVVAVVSIIAFFTYLADKRRAQKNKWRIKEAVLLGLGVFGGALGALLGMNLFRHKTKHWYFWAVNVLFLLVQIALPVFICVYFY